VSGLKRKGLDSLLILGAWMIWKHRNRVVFDGVTPSVMVARSVRDWRGVSMDRNVGRGPLPTAEQDEGFSLLILACFISHPLIT
jgi:hypothetical protein